MKNHIFKVHEGEKAGQECCLLKIEGAYDKNYWLYIDVPLEKTLQAVDAFLRKIWLECCGHLSEFYRDETATNYNRSGHYPVSPDSKLGTFAEGDKFFHSYDFGTTTETLITIMGNIKRKPQKGIVRLLARNAPPVFHCSECGKQAENICTECVYGTDNPFLCAECSEEHEHNDMLLPVTNSPRMGECGYVGEYDTFAFDPATVPKPLN